MQTSHSPRFGKYLMLFAIGVFLAIAAYAGGLADLLAR
jgi:hypothetical protein